MLTSGARTRRLVAAVVATVALVGGTFWGEDDNWPFGPFRMYSVRNRLDGRIRAAQIDLRLADGSVVEEGIGAETFALRRAEVEGQIERFERRPSLLGHIAAVYERLHPESPDVVGVRLYYETTTLEAGRPTGAVTEVTVATWGRA